METPSRALRIDRLAGNVPIVVDTESDPATAYLALTEDEVENYTFTEDMAILPSVEMPSLVIPSA